MLTSTSSSRNHSQLLFAGQKKPSLLKTGFLGMLLGTAGATGLIQQNNSQRNSTETLTPSLPDQFNYTRLIQPLSEKEQKQLDAMIQPEDFKTPTPKKHRKLLQTLPENCNFDTDEPTIYYVDDAADVQARQLLKKPPFAPTNVNLFTTATYPNATATSPAQLKAYNETSMKSELTQIFTKRFNGNSTKVKSAVALMDDPILKKVAPDPKLRAAIVNLKGTIGKSALESYQRGDFGAVRFAPLTSNGIARSITISNKAKPEIEVNEKYKGENFRLFASTMSHEPLHTDTTNSATEELICGAMDILAYAKQLLEDPSLAKANTELTRRQNTQLMARLNTRDKNGDMRLFTIQKNVYPGGTNLTNYAAPFEIANACQGTSTPGNPTLEGMLKRTTGELLINPKFDNATLNLLDKNQKNIKPAQQIKLAKEALGLNVDA